MTDYIDVLRRVRAVQETMLKNDALGTEYFLRRAGDAIEELLGIIPHRCECCVGCELEKSGGGCENGFIPNPERAANYINSYLPKINEGEE